VLVGIIGAMKVEVAELVKAMAVEKVERISTMDFYVGSINGHQVVVVTCGIGKVHAAMCTQTMITRYSPDIIVNTGVAGSLTPKLEIGDCAIASSVVQYDVDTTAFGDPLGMISGIDIVEFYCDPLIVEALSQAVLSVEKTHYETGLIATGDRFLKGGEDKKAILDSFEAIACEMESGSIGQVCTINDIPFGIIRAISDNADSTSCVEYTDFLNAAAAMAAKTVKIFLEKVNLGNMNS